MKFFHSYPIWIWFLQTLLITQIFKKKKKKMLKLNNFDIDGEGILKCENM